MDTSAAQNVLFDKYGYGTQSTKSNEPTSNQDLFLKILTTQLKNQDPSEPVSDKDFITQISGMASVQETSTLNKQLSGLIQLQQVVAGQNAFTQSASLVGKNVKYVDPTTQKEGAGLVSAVKLENGSLLLSINGTDVPMNAVTGITAETPPATAT